MNKTQINYAKERIDVIKKQHLRELDKTVKAPIETPWDQKVGEILSGKATLKVDRITQSLEEDTCPFWLRDLFKFFDFSGDTEFATASELYKKKIKDIKEKITEAADQYLDQIVLDGKTDAAALASFKKRKFI